MSEWAESGERQAVAKRYIAVGVAEGAGFTAVE